MKLEDYFPDLIMNLPAYEGQFEARKLAAEGCDVLFGSYPAGTVIAPHSHETENIGVIATGELLLTIAGETTRIGAGEWYHVPANTVHAAEFPVATADIEFWFKPASS